MFSFNEILRFCEREKEKERAICGNFDLGTHIYQRALMQESIC